MSHFDTKYFASILIAAASLLLNGCDNGTNGVTTLTSLSTGLYEPIGVLDKSFNSTGVVNSIPSDGTFLEGLLANLPNHEIGLAYSDYGNSQQTFRIHLNGTQDTSSYYALGSANFTDLLATSAARGASIVQLDGKVVVGYMTTGPTQELKIIRYNTDGNIDATFGTAGTVTITAYAGGTEPMRILQQNDGKLLILAELIVNPGAVFPAPNFSPVVIRLETDGSLDTNFGSMGIVIPAGISIYSWNAYAMDLDRISGNIYLGLNRIDLVTGWELDTIRILANGTQDSSYGTSGIQVIASNIVNQRGYYDISYDNLAGTVYATYTQQPGGTSVQVTKLLSTGAIDTSFGASGTATVDVSSGAGSETYFTARIRAWLDGKIYVLGNVSAFGSMFMGTSRFVLVRLTKDGQPDSGFGTAGIATSSITDFPWLKLTTFDFLADGRIALGGLAETFTPNTMGPGLPLPPTINIFAGLAIIK